MEIIYIATSTFATYSNDPINLLKGNNYFIIQNSFGRKLLPEEIVVEANNAVGIIAGTECYSKEVLKQLPNLKVISRLGVGMDNVDINVSKENGIKVYKTKTTPAPSVAELTLGLILDVARKISLLNHNLKSGIWDKKMGNLLYGKTLGIIGMGTIGKTLVGLVKGFNFDILAFDLIHDNKYAKENNITYCDLNELLIKSDIISIHINFTNETKHLINQDRINIMKPENILINTSRGEVIDERALFVALKEKKILGAGLDVYNEEPYAGPLIELDNIILTPHIGAYAKEIRVHMEMESATNLIRGLNEA